MAEGTKEHEENELKEQGEGELEREEWRKVQRVHEENEQVGIKCGASLPYVIAIKNSDNDPIFRVLSEKRDCYFTIINDNCSCIQRKPCVHEQIAKEFKEHMSELDEQESLERLIEDYQEEDENIQNQLQLTDEERLGPDVLDLDVDDIIKAEKCALSCMEMDEYQEMTESMTYADKISFLHTCLANRNRRRRIKRSL
jgi:hypothetical protein